MLVCFGNLVSVEFCRTAYFVTTRLGLPQGSHNWLMACMAFETGEQFSASTRNAMGSSGTGLIQFMAATARSLGTTVENLAMMRAEDQLKIYVYEYFKPYAHKIKSLEDMYMAILMPRYIGEPDDAVVFRAGTLAYKQNGPLDKNRDGVITKAECCRGVRAKFERGMQPEFVRVI
nr:MAG TPA: tail protein [Caudoviricetes sp.]